LTRGTVSAFLATAESIWSNSNIRSVNEQP
jgi:hypothetical protein